MAHTLGLGYTLHGKDGIITDHTPTCCPLHRSAPALLEALKDILRDAEGYARTHGAESDSTFRIIRRCDKARAAIEAATIK